MRAVIVPKVLGGDVSTSGASSSGKVVSTPTSKPLVQSKGKNAKKNIDIGMGVGIGIGFPIMFALGVAVSAFVAKRRGVKMGVSVELHNEHVNELQNKSVIIGTTEVEGLAASVRNELYENRRHVELP